jgi:hypothetical protein
MENKYMNASQSMAANPTVPALAPLPSCSEVIANPPATPSGSMTKINPPVTAFPANTAGQ